MNQITVIEVAPGGEAIYVDAVDVVDGIVCVDVIYPPPAISFVEVQVPGIQGPAGPAGPSGSGNWDLIEGKPDTFPPTLPIPQSGITNLTTDLAAKLNLAGGTMTGKLITKASLAGSAYFNIPPGTAPSTPVDGDVWVVGTQLFFQRTGTHTVITSDGTQTISGIKTFSAKPIMTTPAAGTASINLPHGAAPTTPVNGDFWTTTLGLYGRINGVNVGPFTSLPIAQTDVVNLTADLAAKANLAGATFTGRVTVPPHSATTASFCIGPSSGSPSALVDGDIFVTTAGNFLYRANGLTQFVANLGQTQTFTGAKTFSLKTTFATPTTAIASFNTPHGVAPSAPVDGDVWTTATGMYARINGVSVGPFGVSGAADWANITNKPATFPPTLPIPSSGITGLDTALAGMVLKAGDTMTGKLTTPPSTAAGAGFNWGQGNSPGTIVDGDVWQVGATVRYRASGVTNELVNLASAQTISGIKTFSAKPIFMASTTASASINIPAGATPTTPVDGDFWLVGSVYNYRASGVSYSLVNVQGSQSISGIKTFTNKTVFVASAAGQASILLPPGVAPSSPVDGDVWTTAAGMYVRINGAIVGPLAASGGAVDWTLVTGKPATFPPTLPIAQSGITNLETDLALLAPLASPVLTGVPTVPTAAPGTNTTQIASTAFAAAAATAAATGVANNAVLKAGDTMSGDLTIAKATPFLSLDKAAAGQEAGVFIKTGGVTRWSITSNTAAEAGSDAGSNLAINYHADNGTVKGTINFTRADGKFTAKNISSAGYIQSTPTSGSANFYLDRSAGQSGLINFRTGALARWQINCSNAAESGADAGSNFQIIRSSDAGTQIDTVIDLNRATGLMTVKALTATGKVTVPASTTASAGLNVPPGVAPSSPASGDIWAITNQLWFRGANTYELATVNGGQTFTGAKTFGTKTTFYTSATGNASILLPHGVAPSAPINGDMWTTSAGLYVQISGATIGPLGAGSGGSVDWTAITSKPSTFPPDPHVHPQSDITNLVTDLAGKAPLIHTHAQADITNLVTDLAGKLSLTGGTMTGKLNTPASTTASAGFNIAPGTGPTAPVDGDLWVVTSSLLWRGGGSTYSAVNLTGTQTISGAKTFSVPIIIAAGSAAAPSISITGATNTGIFGTTTSVAISTAGVQRLSIAASALFAVKVTFPASVTAAACMTLPHGVAPSAPIDGDVWTTTAGLFVKANGVVVGPLSGSGGGDWSTITGKPSTFPPDPHAHPQSDITNLAADLAGKAATVHTHAQADITNLVTDLAGKAATVHTHAQADITNLTTDIAALMPKAGGSFTNGVGFGSATAASATTLTRHLALYGTTFGFSITSSTLNAVASGKIDLYSGSTLMVSFALAATTFSKKIITLASATTGAGLTLPHGVAPTAPVNGDFWTETTGVFARINGATVGPLGAGGGGLAEAPTDGQAYFRKSAAWAATPTVTVATIAPSTPAVGDIWVDTN